jgi:hypothetical protein
MTDPNVYGVSAEVAYDFGGWTWGGEIPENLIELLSIQAAQLVVQEMARDAHIWLTCNDAGEPIIEFSSLDGHASFSVPLLVAIDQWLASRRGSDDKIHPGDAETLLPALEAAAENIRTHIRR